LLCFADIAGQHRSPGWRSATKPPDDYWRQCSSNFCQALDRLEALFKPELRQRCRDSSRQLRLVADSAA
jgi:hypothetical protein